MGRLYFALAASIAMIPHLAYSGWAACPYAGEGWSAIGVSRQSASRRTALRNEWVIRSPNFLEISPGKERGLGNVRKRLPLFDWLCRTGYDPVGDCGKHDQHPVVYSYSGHHFGFLDRKQEEQEVGRGRLASCSLFIWDGSCARGGRSRRIAPPSASRFARRLPSESSPAHAPSSRSKPRSRSRCADSAPSPA